MALVLFDTNIIIDHLLGFSAATRELAQYRDAAISAISWMEVACKMSPAERYAFNAWLFNAEIDVLQTDDLNMDRAAELRGQLGKSKGLPDCIVQATAEVLGRVIITRNPKDFGGVSRMVHVPYDIVNGVATNIRPPLR